MSDVATAPGAWSRFWFTPIPTTGLAVVRVLSGSLFAFWLLSFLGHQADIFSLNGFFDMRALAEAQRQQAPLPPIEWSIFYLPVGADGARLGESALLFQVVYWAAIIIFVLFALGVATRITGVLTWLCVVSFLANPMGSYEADYLLAILAFYLMIGHLLLGQLNGNLTPIERILGSRYDFVLARWMFPSRTERPPSYAANWTMRLVQIHFAIIIVTSGLHKLQMGDWWAGAALWYPLHPPFETTLQTIQRGRSTALPLLYLLSFIQYAMLAWQIAFPVFAWRSNRWCRAILLGGALAGWLGLAFIFKLPLFGPFLFIGCLTFLTADEWAAIKQRTLAIFERTPASQATHESKKSTAVMVKDPAK